MYGNFPSLGLQGESGSERQKVIVEFSSPNIAREFTAAHLRSTIHGAFIANIYEAMGYSVVRVNYLGDWGKSLGLLGVGWQKYGSEEALNQQTDQFRYIHDLSTKMEEQLRPSQEARKVSREDGPDSWPFEIQGLLAERDAVFKRMEDGEPEAIALWKKLRAISIEYFVKTYARLNIRFDEYSGESQVSVNSGAVAEVESILKDKGVSEEQDGACFINFQTHGFRGLGTAVVRDRNGCTTYLLRDVATVFERLKTYAFDKMVYVVCEQELHFRRVFKVVALMGHADVANKLQHLTFAGANGHWSHLDKVQQLDNILDQCEKHMHEKIIANPDCYQIEDCDAVAKAMRINSLVIQELSLKKHHRSSFDSTPLTLPEVETGTSLQLCYARLCSAIASIGLYPNPEEIPHVDFNSLSEPPWSELLRLIARYPDATHFSFRALDPRIIVSYLFRVTEELTLCLDDAAEDEPVASKYAARAVLFENVRQVLENGMKLLGTTPVSKWVSTSLFNSDLKLISQLSVSLRLNKQTPQLEFYTI